MLLDKIWRSMTAWNPIFVVRGSTNICLCVFVSFCSLRLFAQQILGHFWSRLIFGMFTVLTNIRSTKVLWLVEDDLRWKTTFGGRWPSVEDSLLWKQPSVEDDVDDDIWYRTTFFWRWPSLEDNLWWKTTFGRRQPSVEDDLWWKATFSGRPPSVEDDLYWKTSLVEYNLCWKMTFGGRWPSVEHDLQWKMTFGEDKL